MLFQSRKPVSKEALAPKRDHFTAGVQPRSNLIVGQTFGRVEDHPGSLNLKIL
jgi:hypothetical protein